MSEMVYLIDATDASAPCEVCGGRHEFHSVNHVPVVVRRPEEWPNPAARRIPVEYQPGRQILLSDHLASRELPS